MMMLPVLLACGGVSAFRSVHDLPQGVAGYTVGRLTRAGTAASPAPPLTELKITDHVLTLRRANMTDGREGAGGPPSMSATYVQAMREHGRVRQGRAVRATNGSTALQAVEGGAVFLAGVTVGGQDFEMVIDTGSSDPWLVGSDFNCYDSDSDDSPQDESYCEFGPSYVESPTFQSVPGLNFNISYADGEYLTGKMGLETFTMAGITVPKQQFGLVDQAAWLGDMHSSGLVGFAYRALTSAHNGTDPSKDNDGNTVPYNPLFQNMYTNAGVPALFSMAIDRDITKGGVMALGGIPNIPHAPYYASAAIIPVGVNDSNNRPVYEFYTIETDGYAVSDSPGAQFNPYDNNNTLKIPLMTDDTNVIIDSGTSLCYLPESVVIAVMKAFQPPGTYDASTDTWMVACDATAPVFGVSVGSKIFYMNAADMILHVSRTECMAAIQSDNGGLTILGAAWMKNVIAVFDVAAERMHFAARQYYSTS